jgi:hypothetical protein
MSDDELFPIIRKRGRPALNRLKMMSLRKNLKRGGMFREELHLLLEDVDRYPELLVNPQALYAQIKRYSMRGMEEEVPEFWILKAVGRLWASNKRLVRLIIQSLSPIVGCIRIFLH